MCFPRTDAAGLVISNHCKRPIYAFAIEAQLSFAHRSRSLGVRRSQLLSHVKPAFLQVSRQGSIAMHGRRWFLACLSCLSRTLMRSNIGTSPSQFGNRRRLRCGRIWVHPWDRRMKPAKATRCSSDAIRWTLLALLIGSHDRRGSGSA